MEELKECKHSESGSKSKLERFIRENEELKLMWNHESLKYFHDN